MQRERERERARPIHQKHRRVAPNTGEIAPIVATGSSSVSPSRSSPPKTDPPRTDLIQDPPKTELIHRAMPKAPASRPLQLRCPLHFFLFKLNPKPRNLETQKTHSSNPLRRTHHSNEPIPQTHFSNPHWPPSISLSLSLKSLSHASLLF